MDPDEDLGALFARITRRLIDAERPLLEAHGLSMWEYVALSELATAAAPSQLALARRIGYDKTRLIALLDRLAELGLVARTPDPDDRRAHVLALTEAGTAQLVAVRREIRAMENELLAELELDPDERAAFRTVLRRLAGPRTGP
jgi:DNA-binding MarR family transcriptional regulator